MSRRKRWPDDDLVERRADKQIGAGCAPFLWLALLIIAVSAIGRMVWELARS